MGKAAQPMAVAAGVLAAATLTVHAERQHHHDQHMHSADHEARAVQDTRTLVQYPEPLRIHTLANMRDHLLTLQKIQAALAENRPEQAATIAERRLGMSPLRLHGAHEVAQYMPDPMQKMGTEMHRSASRFAVVATDAAISGDIKPALAALAEVTQACVACHASFRSE